MSMAERPIFGNVLIHVPKAALKSDLRYLTPVSTGIIEYYSTGVGNRGTGDSVTFSPSIAPPGHSAGRS